MTRSPSSSGPRRATRRSRSPGLGLEVRDQDAAEDLVEGRPDWPETEQPDDRGTRQAVALLRSRGCDCGAAGPEDKADVSPIVPADCPASAGADARRAGRRGVVARLATARRPDDLAAATTATTTSIASVSGISYGPGGAGQMIGSLSERSAQVAASEMRIASDRETDRHEPERREDEHRAQPGRHRRPFLHGPSVRRSPGRRMRPNDTGPTAPRGCPPPLARYATTRSSTKGSSGSAVSSRPTGVPAPNTATASRAIAGS